MEWKTAKLSSIAKFSQGKQIPIENQFMEDAINRDRFIRIVDFTSDFRELPRYVEANKKYHVDNEDIVMIRYGTPGRVFRGGTGIIANNMFKITYNEELIDKDYGYWYLKQKCIYNFLMLMNCSATMPAISFKMLDRVHVRFPNLSVQHRIASILSTYDTLIENNTKRIRLLEKMAENLYKEWFVRFRFPGHEKVEMENGLLKGWSIIKIKELSNVKSGFAFKSEWFTDAGCRVAKIKDIGGVLMDTSDLSYVSEDNCKKAEKFILREGDLTIALTGATIGKISIVPKHRGLIYTNQRLGKFFNGDNPIENLPFLYCLFAQDIMVQDIMNLSNSSSAQPNISPEQIGNIKFKGNMDLIKRYNEVAKGFFQEILSLHEMNQNLARQRDLLLPRLMSGKLEV